MQESTGRTRMEWLSYCNGFPSAGSITELRDILEQYGSSEFPAMPDMGSVSGMELIVYAQRCVHYAAFRLLDACCGKEHGLSDCMAPAIWKCFTDALEAAAAYGSALLPTMKERYDRYRNSRLADLGLVGLDSPCDAWNEPYMIDPALRSCMAVMAVFGIAVPSGEGIFFPDFSKSDLHFSEDPDMFFRYSSLFSHFRTCCQNIFLILEQMDPDMELSWDAIRVGESCGWASLMLPRECFRPDVEHYGMEQLIRHMGFSLGFKKRLFLTVPENLDAVCRFLGENGLDRTRIGYLPRMDRETFLLLFGTAWPEAEDRAEEEPPAPPAPSYIGTWVDNELSAYTDQPDTEEGRRRFDEDGKYREYLKGCTSILQDLSMALGRGAGHEAVTAYINAVALGWRTIIKWRIRNAKDRASIRSISDLSASSFAFRVLWRLSLDEAVGEDPLGEGDIPEGLFGQCVEYALSAARRDGIIGWDTGIERLEGWLEVMFKAAGCYPRELNEGMPIPGKTPSEWARLFLRDGRSD